MMMKNNKGFTLVELIIVVAIIAILAAVLAPQYMRYVENTKESADVQIASSIEDVVNILYASGELDVNDEVRWKVSTGVLLVWIDGEENASLSTSIVNKIGSSTDGAYSKNNDFIVQSKNALSVPQNQVLTFKIVENSSNISVTVSDSYGNPYDYTSWVD